MLVAPPLRDGSIKEFQMLQAAMSEASVVIHGPPDFPEDAEILGVCAVSTENADQNKYGWMVADFLSWKTLFHGTWLSSLDISKFLDHIDGLKVSNDDAVHKIFGDDGGHVNEIPANSSRFVASFLKHVAEKAQSAKARDSSLVILVFAPVTPDQDICVDFSSSGEGKTYLTPETICKTISTAVSDLQLPVTLVTPSPFTGGWLCRPALLGLNACSSSDNMMRIIAKSCGGAFANYFMRYFTQRNTPLLTDAQRRKAQYDNLMPVGPTELQTSLLHKFQRLIHESLEQRISVLARDHGLILHQDAARNPSRFTDSWRSYAPRHGRALEYWVEKWHNLPPVVEADRFEFVGHAFGGSKASQAFHLRYLSAIELETCPGDWNRYVNGITYSLLKSFSEIQEPQEDMFKRVFDAIEFRASSMVLAQSLARALDLPMPDGLKCRYWNDKIDGVDDKYYARLQVAFGEIHNLFDQAAVFPSEKPHEYKAVRFQRAARWLSAAIASKFSEHDSREDIKVFVLRDVAQLVTKIRDTQRILLLENQAVKHAGLRWIAALGMDEGEGEATAVSSTVSRMSATNGLADNVGSLVSKDPVLAALFPANFGRAALSPTIQNVQRPAKSTEQGSHGNIKVTPVAKCVISQFSETRDPRQAGLDAADTNLTSDKKFRRIAAMHNIRTARCGAEQVMIGSDSQCIPVTNGSGPWEEAANSTTSNTGRTREQVQPAAHWATESVLGERKEASSHAEKRAALVVQDATRDVREDQENSNQPAAVSSYQQNELADMLSGYLSRLLIGNPQADVANITQVLVRTVETLLRERAGEASCGAILAPISPTGDAITTGHTLCSVLGTGERANKTAGIHMGKDEVSIRPSGVRQGITGHSRVNSPDIKMEFMTMSDSTPSCTRGAGEKAGKLLSENKGKEGQATADGETAVSNGLADCSGSLGGCYLASGDDFFTRGRIPWSGRN
ncbi:hypothetical protein MFIFM68171_01913 [Madurella fahalii]|uniref:Uncharacterized protein n=1 Tax=Madurella fahalii TaxID=1157608 RepID=A0ABQ0G1R7_9PEZI